MKNTNKILREADYMQEYNATIRQTAQHFSCGKTTIHKDLTERLKKIDIKKYHNIQNILKNHINTRHLIGGSATKQKYRN